MHALLQHEMPLPAGNEAAQAHGWRPDIIERGIGRALRERLLEMHAASFDDEVGGLRLPIKFLDADSIEYSQVLAAANHPREANRAQLTLDNALALIDPAWGGIYRYSGGGRWDRPHHGKTLGGQAAALKSYSLAYALFREDRYLTAARRIRDYLQDFLRGGDGFCHGQSDAISGIDADRYFALGGTARLEYGTPPVSRHRPVHENGAAIEALAACYEFCGEATALQLAFPAADWLIRTCRMDSGGFRPADTEHCLRLADTLAAGRGMLQLFRVTGDGRYLELARDAADFIGAWFTCGTGGFMSAITPGRHIYTEPQIDENVSAVRFLNLLSHYCGCPAYRDMAAEVFQYLGRPGVASGRIEASGILLADLELSTRPITISIAGPATDPQTRDLFCNALKLFGWYKVIQWGEKA